MGPKSNLHPRMEISSIGSLTLKSPLSCYCFKYYWLILKKKKNAYFDRNLLHFNGTGMARKQPLESFFEKWMFWVVTCLGLNAFLPIWVLFALDFVVILLAVVTATRSFRGKHQYLYFIKKKKSTWNKDDNLVPLNFFN